MSIHYITTWEFPADPEAVPLSTAQHLLESQGRINRLAAEQDLEILDIQAELERVKADLEMLKAKRNTGEWLTIAVLVLIIGIMFAGKRF
ncbi:hypothetical protein FPSE_07353 [Fusarium pseudograminearum CS3096]|uniref:Uncharacterized protein n=1 Tax=Fusarium pseudograminearum (strain CS3096) TaxID=1028729 RepID=K3VEA4_FUSPC|nr:hypothetical protein FPSE_07353 [Fusarium pseudograminearum CS3096]EKJ72472.1 hypothetical protein FPSE_07353 [Fusarium pseudograminearum CS3096]KAF0637703.1 hypothetical protein FPSE5266_07353 [Fusarium pseudograminearum]